jgi:hypothetical protein
MQWGLSILSLINFPVEILPSVVDSAGKTPIAIVDASIFGAPIPIGAVVRVSSHWS